MSDPRNSFYQPSPSHPAYQESYQPNAPHPVMPQDTSQYQNGHSSHSSSLGNGNGYAAMTPAQQVKQQFRDSDIPDPHDPSAGLGGPPSYSPAREPAFSNSPPSTPESSAGSHDTVSNGRRGLPLPPGMSSPSSERPPGRRALPAPPGGMDFGPPLPLPSSSARYPSSSMNSRPSVPPPIPAGTRTVSSSGRPLPPAPGPSGFALSPTNTFPGLASLPPFLPPGMPPGFPNYPPPPLVVPSYLPPPLPPLPPIPTPHGYPQASLRSGTPMMEISPGMPTPRASNQKETSDTGYFPAFVIEPPPFRPAQQLPVPPPQQVQVQPNYDNQAYQPPSTSQWAQREREEEEDGGYGIGEAMLSSSTSSAELLPERKSSRRPEALNLDQREVGGEQRQPGTPTLSNPYSDSAAMPTPQYDRSSSVSSRSQSEVQHAYGHRDSTVSITTLDQSATSHSNRGTGLAPSWTNASADSRPPARWVQNKLFLHQSHANAAGVSPSSQQQSYEDGYFAGEAAYRDDPEDEWLGDEGQEEGEEEEEEENEMNFFNPSLLSHVSVQLRDRVTRGSHVKGGIPWPGSFTGRDLVTTIQSFLPTYTRVATSDRRFALSIALSLQNQLFFVEVDWDVKPLRDSVDNVFQFMNEVDGVGGAVYELPTGVETMVTKCYSPSCQADSRCYSPMCPFRTDAESFLSAHIVPDVAEASSSSSHTHLRSKASEWSQNIDPEVLKTLAESEVRRQTIIYQAISAEEQYEADLNAVETLFISPLRIANPPIVRSLKDLEELINDLFGNILELREANARLLEFFALRQREDGALIRTIGDGFLAAAAEFHNIYPTYIGNLPKAEERLREEMAHNAEFRFFVDRVVRQNENRRMDIKFLITRPSTQLNRYPQMLEAILNETPQDSADVGFLAEAIRAIKNLGLAAQLQLFQASSGKDEASNPAAELAQRKDPAALRDNIGGRNWYQFVALEDLATMTDHEKAAQETIWELIKGEMSYVADLRVIDNVYVAGLREADDPVIERARLEVFVDDVFHNYRSLLDIHERLLEALHNRQTEQHPHFGAIGDLIFDAALQWQEAYLEYTSHYPKAKFAIDEEKQSNPKFAAWLDRCRSLPGVGKRGPADFLILPIQRLLRYPLLLKDLLKILKKIHTNGDHADIETIPQVVELIGEQGKQSQKGVITAESKVELWQMPQTLTGGKFGDAVIADLDLRNPMRELLHRGRVLRQPEGTISNTWTELNALLFDNYFVLTKVSKSSKNAEGPIKYQLNKRPVPLELLTLGSFSDNAQNRSLGLLKTFSKSERHESNGPEAASESRTVYPFNFILGGQSAGQHTLWVESASSRDAWLAALQQAKALRAADIEANKVFEMNPLSIDTFFSAPSYAPANPRVDANQQFTGRVTSSFPFRTPDNRSLVGIGCDEGVYIGLRHDPKSLRKVLHVKNVTQITVLEQFSMFLVLSNRTLLAYPLEALVPSSNAVNAPRGHQKLSGSHEVIFFAAGQLNGRTLVIYLRKKGLDSVFRCLEPIAGREVEERRRPFGGILTAKSEWFRMYKEFFIASDSTHLHFLKNKLIVVCARGFEIIDLTELEPASIPVFDPVKVKADSQLTALKQKCDTGRPLGLFRSTESEFLLVYSTFGFFVNRHGFPNRDYRIIEWEGLPESAAFHPPYLVLFSLSFMEIRHISDGRLLQIYNGSDMRCSFDGTTPNPGFVIPTPGREGYTEAGIEPEAILHMVQRSGRGRRGGGWGQDVYELSPTLLLNNPITLAGNLNTGSGGDSNYFPPVPPLQYGNGGPSNSYGYSPWR